MQKRGISKLILTFIFIMLIILITTIASANWLDWIKTITGKATSQPTNVSIAITGINNVTITVWNYSLGGINPTENSIVAVQFNVTVMDPDGAADINTSSVNASFYFPGEQPRYNTSCTERSGESNNTAKNFSCAVNMWYWDINGVWTIAVTANDLGGKLYVTNSTTNFTYNQLIAFVLAPGSLTWPGVSPGNKNQTSNNDPLWINNTGNWNASGKINISALNLYGETTTTEYLSAGNFTIDIAGNNSASCTAAECVECDGDKLVNGTYVTLTGSVLERGNLSAGDQANESIFYCLTLVPTTISSQTYSTNLTGSWTIKTS